MTTKQFHAVGKRKSSIARVWMKEGTGNITINKRTLDNYFIRETAKMIAKSSLSLVEMEGKWDININVCGGGLMGQAGAIRHGVAKAFLLVDGELRPTLKKAGMLTRDARKKERKKYGQKGARARFQFSKR